VNAVGSTDADVGDCVSSSVGNSESSIGDLKG
jgi:hypothetical protein